MKLGLGFEPLRFARPIELPSLLPQYLFDALDS
jgi:hypothetical protein